MDNPSQPLPPQERRAAQPAARGTVPRLGAFVTIAVSLLLLFGAASRIGKVPETAALFGIDSQAETRIRQEEERQRTALMIGSVPVNRGEIRPPINTVWLDPDAAPPPREGVDADAPDRPGESGYESALSLSIPQAVDDADGGDGLAAVVDSAGPPLDLDAPPRAAPRLRTYKVQNGDTWIKVAKRTLGDAERWRDLMNANPAARNGLRVGMELAIPGDA